MKIIKQMNRLDILEQFFQHFLKYFSFHHRQHVQPSSTIERLKMKAISNYIRKSFAFIRINIYIKIHLELTCLSTNKLNLANVPIVLGLTTLNN